MKKIHLLLFLIFITGITRLYSQTASQNYILTRTYTNDAGSAYLDNIQYFDGLGRPVETVQKSVTPAKADLVSYQEYDLYGRESNAWLPAIAAGNNGAYMALAAFTSKSTATYNNTTYNAASDAKPYSYPVYEFSPLNRITDQYGPGADWQTNGKSVKTGYLTNLAKAGTAWVDADSLVCGRYISTDDKKTVSLYRADNYAANELYVTRTKDENENTSYEFKNKLGQVLLIRQINAGKSFDTNYIYDNFGNLRAVLPPEASVLLLNATSTAAWTETNANLKLYAYLYKYDNRNRCIAKKLPGCEWTYYVYDKADRLIFTQDGENRKAGVWQFSIPDVLGRAVLTGTCKNSINYSSDPFNTVVITGIYNTSRINLANSYTIPAVSLASLVIFTANFYDNYNFMGIPEIPNNTDTQYNPESGYATRYTGGYNGMLTGTATAQLNPDGSIASTYLYSIMYYDNRNRLIQTKSNNQLSGGYEKEYIAYNFSGQPTGKKHIHSATGKTTQTEVYVNTYDHAERLTKTTHQLNAGTITTIAENTYDELGRLKTNKKGGQANLNTTYAYNIRSWVKSITNPLFTETLYYNESYGGSLKQYNGNLSAMSWKLSSEANTRGYALSYNNLSWLSAANYLENGNANTNYKTAYTYDSQGNIKALQRYGKTTATAYGLIDNLTMTHTGNQLTKVEDTAPNISLAESADFKNYSNVATEYTYNTNGAMTKDLNKGISDIQYNLLNLPKQMDIKSSVAEARNEYTYSATGQKLKVVQKWNPNYSTAPVIGSAVNASLLTMSKTTEYVDNMIYENNALKRILIDGGYIEGGVYHYYVTDHLGNNRLVVNASGTVVQKNHYYPFGMSFAETSVAEQGKQPYKYNGKELDQMNGLNLYDNLARLYDPAIGRTLTPDPLCEKYYSISPYSWCMNNPIKYVDLRGDSLTLVGSTTDVQATANTYNTGLGGFYTTSADANGKMSISPVAGTNPNNMTAEQKAYYSALDKVVSGTDGMTTINVVNGTSIVIGDVIAKTIDIGDIQSLGNGTDINQGSALLHETFEQYGVQVKGQTAIAAHLNASGIERLVTGSYIDPINRPLVSGQLSIPILTPAAGFTNSISINTQQLSIPILDPTTGNTLKTVIIYVNSAGNVIGIKR